MSEIAHQDPDVPAFGVGVASKRAAVPAASPRVRKWPGRSGYKRMLQGLVVLAAVGVASVAGYRTVTRPAAVRVSSAVTGSVREETRGPGTVQSRYSVSLGSRVAGTIDRMLVDVGDEVKKGQLLATLDRTELDARVQSTRRAVESAQQDVVLAKANLAKARSDLDLARIKSERARRLVTPGVLPVADADEARAALRSAEANEGAAIATVDSRLAARARLVQDQHVAQTVLSYTAIESPMAGVVTRRALEPGSAVAPGVVVLQIVDANTLWIATLIDQSLTDRVSVGQRAIIRLRSGAEVTGHVARIAFEADPVTRELEVDVAFDVRPSRFAIHEEADVTILGRQAQGLTVPLAALSHGPDSTAVYIVENGRARRQRVRIGIEGAKRAQVIEGLHEGASVIVTPNIVRDGQRVTAATGG